MHCIKFAARFTLSFCASMVLFSKPAFAVKIYDLAADWSDTANPNGVWSYNDSDGPITVHQSDWNPEPFWEGQDAWAYASGGPGHIVNWLKSDRTLTGVQSNQGLYDLEAGDVTTHTWDMSSALPTKSNNSNVTWTAPNSGTYEFHGNMWQAFFREDRAVNASVIVKGQVVNTASFGNNDPYSRAAPFTFEGMVDLAAGDVIELYLFTSNQPGTHMGMNLTVTKLLPGDYNDDGVVDSADYVVWRDNISQSITLPNDLTPGSVTQEDYGVWRANFGKIASGSALGAATNVVPEPANMLSVIVVVLILGRKWQNAGDRSGLRLSVG